MAIFRVPINITFPGAGSPGVNVWHIKTNDANLSTELTQANALIGYMRTLYDAIKIYYPATTVLSLGTVTEELTSREITPTMASVTGTGTGSAPQLLALVVTWRTNVASRRGRGRTFLGPLATAAMQSDGTPSATLLTAAGDAAQALITSSQAYLNGQIGVYGYEDPKTPGKLNPRDPTDPKIFREFTGRSIRDLFGSLRSRRD
jgi:hypothetical protein